jgi:acetyltransferase-like isoleucine patch superfamily enzyme
VKELLLIGAGKFALEVTRYIDDVAAAGLREYRVTKYLAVAGEAVHAPADLCSRLEGFDPPPGVGVVLALSDPARRRAVIDGFIAKHDLQAENIVHPSARVEPGALTGPGNVIGPDNYVGVNTTLGGFNVLNYRSSIGHHSRLGSNNFIAPNFHCGNSVEIGDDNFFGLSCTVAPEVIIGGDCKFQAGISLFDNAASGYSYLVPNRIKSVKSLQGDSQ